MRKVLLPNRRISTPLGRIHHAATLYGKTRWHSQSARLSRYTLLYLLRGQGACRDSHHSEFELRAGSLLLMFPETSYSYGPDKGTSWDEFFINFDGPFYRSLQYHGIIHPGDPIYHIQPVSTWLERFHYTLRDPPQKSMIGRIREITIFSNLFMDILVTRSSFHTPSTTPAWILQAKRLLEKNLELRLDVPALAQRLNLTYETFRKQFRHHTGISPGQFRLQRKLEASCHLLQSTPVSIKEIANRLGFFNETHFTSWFKTKKRTTPQTFRKTPSLISYHLSKNDKALQRTIIEDRIIE
jgi:AraC-like DNA-binding protein